MSEPPAAALVLADGTVFRGRSIGAAGLAVGEVVFNTAMTGYQEILTDPSYCRQIVTLTYPHIGNTGVNAQDEESARIHAAALVVRDVPARFSNWRAQESLPAYLERSGVVGIADIDTRKLTRLLREKGAQNGCVVAAGNGKSSDSSDSSIGALVAAELDRALLEARKFPGLAGMDLAKVVSTPAKYEWTRGAWRLGKGFKQIDKPPFHVVAFDYGIKRNILRMLVERGARVTVLPAQTSADDALGLAPDGVFLSNGPGDPEPCDYAIRAIRTILEDTRIPVFGICLGHQLMGLASGAKTMKMKFGHHGANHPVKDLDSGVVSITSQNHGFAVDPATLPKTLRTTHVSLFDGSLQGLARIDRPAFCFQGHPEASPGPRDIGYLFDRFAQIMEVARRA
ncbi:MAG: carbamoyl-phosphate synthase small subunit [Betaproteobacteria bacterium]|nr:carbamoyl-phosphate synthase small subunit [Betaproteobacteria bacterium]